VERAVGSAASTSVVRGGGGGTTELFRLFQTNGRARKALDDRHAPRMIMGHYWGDLDTKDLLRMRHAAAKRFIVESVSCGGLEDRLAEWRAALRRDPCNLGK
jgi:hypothetical protein